MSTVLNTSIEPQFRTIDGLKIRFAESEQRDDHALLLSPWPETIHAFDQMWHRLAEHTHLVAVDLPGFGHSERRNSLLAPRTMGQFVIRLADEFGLEQPHAVGPDIGTGALLFAAADNPGRLLSIVVGSGERYELPDHVREDYLSAYDGDRFVESMRYVRAYPTELPILAELLPHIETPVEIIGGLWDWAVPPSNHRYLHERLPNSNLDLIDAGHFAWEDAADEYARIVTGWWAGGYADAGSGR
jgi:pimeloyl-ACP methyl ester carboxylesterase